MLKLATWLEVTTVLNLASETKTSSKPPLQWRRCCWIKTSQKLWISKFSGVRQIHKIEMVNFSFYREMFWAQTFWTQSLPG